MKYSSVLLLILLMSCWKSKTKYVDYCTRKVDGWKPVLRSAAEFKVVTAVGSRNTVQPGKIYVYNNFILQVEQGEGIHVIDNSDPHNPVKKAFLQIKGCSEVEMKDGHIYTNNLNDLVTLQYNFSNNSVQEKNRLMNAFKSLPVNYSSAEPPGTGYYKCYWSTDSVAVNWIRDSISGCQACFKN